jgi:hypothetical protein
MDTKFWGPDGWRLLHTLAYIYPSNPSIHIQMAYYNFFTMLKDILPCKYCRASFEVFLKELSIKPYLNSPRNLRLWLYRIHNKVNNKLRKQGLLDKANPTLKHVDSIYEKIIKNGKDYSFKLNTGWDFLFSIIYNYDPTSHNPIVYEQWFNLLAEITPCDLYKHIYNKIDPISTALKASSSLQKWFYEFQKEYLTHGLKQKCDTFSNTCLRYEQARVSACQKATCRKSTSL